MTQHIDEMREAFEALWLKVHADEKFLAKHNGCYMAAQTAHAYCWFIEGCQAATASTEAKYLPVIEKLAEALDYIRDDFVEYWYGESGKSADLKSIIDAEKALALAAQVLKEEE